MICKLLRYGRTIKNMRPIQIYARAKKMLGFGSSLGVHPAPMPKQVQVFESVKELDYDEVFMSRFPVDEFGAGKLTFLHESEQFDWKSSWHFENHSALWNFNLHYFEFLMPLAHAYKATGKAEYLQCVMDSVNGWIAENPQSSGSAAWASYTIAIRLVYWFACLFVLSNDLSEPFKERMMASIYAQYVYLSNHLEKDLLANHYFEDLKALILCAIAFSDDRMLRKSVEVFKEQLKAQILPDGMHYELSPMYHKIILEDVLRVAVALRSINRRDTEIEGYLQSMLDVAYTFEDGLERIPLFNDSGNNVAKSLDALLLTAKNHFEITPVRKNRLQYSGYYFFRSGSWTLIVDAGAPGTKENPGHVQCDAMSFELFHNGHPALVNCGTYAYQCADRSFFRSTAAHNTVMVDGVEQSECWGNFRMGRGSKTTVLCDDGNGICMKMQDQHRQTVQRTIRFENNRLVISDKAEGKKLKFVLHLHGIPTGCISASGSNVSCYREEQWYAADYGERTKIAALVWDTEEQIAVSVELPNQKIYQT